MQPGCFPLVVSNHVAWVGMFCFCRFNLAFADRDHTLILFGLCKKLVKFLPFMTSGLVLPKCGGILWPPPYRFVFELESMLQMLKQPNSVSFQLCLL